MRKMSSRRALDTIFGYDHVQRFWDSPEYCTCNDGDDPKVGQCLIDDAQYYASMEIVYKETVPDIWRSAVRIVAAFEAGRIDLS